MPEAVAFVAMVETARRLAVALTNDALRRDVFDALHASRFREHKIHFQSFTDAASGPGARLIAAMAAAGAVPLRAMKALRDSAIDLELYMPVKQHFATWNGDSQLLVATTWDVDDDIPIAFDLAGRRVQLVSAEVPPANPTLVLVRVETNFATSRSLTECAPEVILCDDTLPPPPPPPPPPAGVNVEFSYIADDHEGFGGGSPEYEIFAAYPRSSGSNQAYYNQCVGAQAGNPGRGGTDLGAGAPGIVSGAYSWDQDDETWSGHALVLSQAQIDAGALVDTSVTYWVFEDDNTACVIKLGSAGEPDTVVAHVAQRVAQSRNGFRNKPDEVADPLTAVYHVIHDIIGLIIGSSKDDIVGMLVRAVDVQQTYSDANMAIVNGDGGIEGRMKLTKY